MCYSTRMSDGTPFPSPQAQNAEIDYLRSVSIDGIVTLLMGAVMYFSLLMIALCWMAPRPMLGLLFAQKGLYIVILLFAIQYLKAGKIPPQQFDNVVSALLVMFLSSALVTSACGLGSTLGTHCAILMLSCAAIAISFRRVAMDWALIWVVHLHFSPFFAGEHLWEETLKLGGVQCLALPFMVLRLRLYHRQYNLLRELAGALAESEEVRAGLDRSIESRTEQLRMANEEMRLSAQEREKLQEQLLQSQKMESLGRLAGGVAHDFNNLLTVILGSLELARTSDAGGTEWQELLQEADTAARRAAEVTSQLLAFSRKQVMNVKPLKIQQVVAGSLKMVERLLGEDIKLEVSLNCPTAVVEGDVSLLQQVLLNLVVNARDAMPAGGKLSIALRQVGLEVELSLSDSGCGIDPALHGRIFEPFFTTKPFGEGTGLGLATVDGIVSMHSGRMQVKSEPGQGATFSVYLPLFHASLADSSVRRIVPNLPGKGAILLVEDDDQLRNLALRVLQLSGYQVKAMENGEKALQSLEVDASYDLLVTDVVMPGLDGGKLAEAVRKIRNDMPVLFMSGYTDDRLSKFGIERGECDFLAKPFTPAQLITTVGDILERSKVASRFLEAALPGLNQ